MEASFKVVQDDFQRLRPTHKRSTVFLVKPHPRKYAALLLALCAAMLFPARIIADTNVGVEDAVRQYFADAPVMISIAKCESEFTMFSGDKALSGGSGGMIGVFQVNAAVHADAAADMGMSIYTLNGNLAYARYLYVQQGTEPWLSSAACWKKKLAQSEPASKSSTISQDNEVEIAHLKEIIVALMQVLGELRRLHQLATR